MRGKACSPPRSCISRSMASPDRAGSCRTAGSTSCSRSEFGHTRTPSRPCTATGSGPTVSSTPVPISWDEPCWRGACAAKASWRVVTERNLDWMAAVLAIFKAGGAYLPIEPHFPADRIARTLSRAGCRLVLTERGSTATLDQALDSLSGVETLFIDAAYEEDHPDGDLGVDVAPDQLAYIYFTSGSTGEPKGAMCEHAGHAQPPLRQDRRPEDRRGGRGGPDGTPVLRHLAVATGFRAAGRWADADRRAGGDPRRAGVSSTRSSKAGWPSFRSCRPTLKSSLSYLAQHPRELPDLRCVSATGEALKKELAQRWFAVQPGDQAGQRVRADRDLGRHQPRGHGPRARPGTCSAWSPLSTMCASTSSTSTCHRCRSAHQVRSSSPGSVSAAGTSTIPSARDERSWPIRTARATGCTGAATMAAGCRRASWSSSAAGIRRSRSVASASRSARSRTRLLRLPGVHDGAVVVTERADRSKHLVAFYSGERPIDANVLRDQLRESLPKYMVPSAFHWRSSAAVDGQRQDRQEGFDGARRRARCRRAEPRRAEHGDRALAGGRMGRGARHPEGPDRQAGSLLRPGRHVVVGTEAGDRPRPCGVLQGPHRSPDSRRSGRADRRQVRAAASDVRTTVGAVRGPVRTNCRA